MTHEDKIKWMKAWCKNNGVKLQLKGSCGFGRECVGILVEGYYPDYEWSNWSETGNTDDEYQRVDSNGDVWTPEDAYHKHPCVAVLGRGIKIEEQLYNWLKWFDDNNFKIEVGENKRTVPLHPIEKAMGKARYKRIVRQ